MLTITAISIIRLPIILLVDISSLRNMIPTKDIVSGSNSDNKDAVLEPKCLIPICKKVTAKNWHVIELNIIKYDTFKFFGKNSIWNNKQIIKNITLEINEI